MAARTAALRFPHIVLVGNVVAVMAEPGDEMAAADRGYLRASHADRDHVIDILKAAFVQGRVTRDELDLRVGEVLTSRTYADLAALTADLPAGLIGTQAPEKSILAQAQRPVNKVLLRGSWVVVLLTIGFMVGAIPASPLFALVVGRLPLLIAAPIAGSLTLDSWREKRSRGQLPRRPAQPGQALEGEHNGAIGDDLIACEIRHARWSATRRQGQQRSAHLPVTA